MNTKAVEDYVKAIYKLNEQGAAVTTSNIAAHLSVTAASVTGMLKKLHQLKLIDYEPYKPVELTPAGLKIALEVIRHHRLVELFLAEALGMSWDKVHDEAERLEHVISAELEAHIDAALGHPEYDPHGDPIPSREGVIAERATVALYEAPLGVALAVARVSDHDADLLRYFGDMGLYPGTELCIERREPFDGPVVIAVAGTQQILGRAVAEHIQVMPTPAAAAATTEGRA